MLPAVLYETLRMADSPTKRALISAQTRQVWSRAMPEAFSEAEELRRAIEVLRPEWMRSNPDLADWRRLRADWDSDMKAGTWARARKNTKQMTKWIGDGAIPTAREEAVEARATARQIGLSFDRLKVEKFESWFEEPVQGWDGKPFATWRAESLNAWLPTFAAKGHSAYADWLSPWIRPQILPGQWASWVQYWTRDVSAEALPRQWIRTAMRVATSTRSTTAGTPVDLQISTYLYDLHDFYSCDTVLVDCIKKIAAASPRPLARPHLLRGNADAVHDLIRAILS
jgi:hypothetical protein